MRGRAVWWLRVLARRLLPPLWRARLRNAWLQLGNPSGTALDVRQAAEQLAYAGQEVVHALPPIHHYWAERHLRSRCEQLGFGGAEEFFLQQLLEAYDIHACQRGAVRFTSLGAGNCDLEVALSRQLVEAGRRQFRLDCLESNPAMRQRGLALAAEAGLREIVVPVAGDFNDWKPDAPHAAVLANQSLHHVQALESLFDAVQRAIGTSGLFLVSDIIGRNGHLRWPEALEVVRELWTELPPSYRYNLQLHRRERSFKDWDCSIEGFEGIRAQDILPLLVERFGFRAFLAWGNVIDPFIDRAFGPHFDPGRAWDREFIDKVQARDDADIDAGRIKPTHVIAALCNDRSVETRMLAPRTPEFCVRDPARKPKPQRR